VANIGLYLIVLPAFGARILRRYSSGDRRKKKLSVNTNEVVPFGAAMQVMDMLGPRLWDVWNSMG